MTPYGIYRAPQPFLNVFQDHQRNQNSGYVKVMVAWQRINVQKHDATPPNILPNACTQEAQQTPALAQVWAVWR